MSDLSKESRIILYQADGDKEKVDVYFAEENFWITLKNISELFNIDRTVITKHLKNVFDEGDHGHAVQFDCHFLRLQGI